MISQRIISLKDNTHINEFKISWENLLYCITFWHIKCVYKRFNSPRVIIIMCRSSGTILFITDHILCYLGGCNFILFCVAFKFWGQNQTIRFFLPGSIFYSKLRLTVNFLQYNLSIHIFQIVLEAPAGFSQNNLLFNSYYRINVLKHNKFIILSVFVPKIMVLNNH